MSGGVSISGEVDLGGLVSHLLDDVVPAADAVGKIMFPNRSTSTSHPDHHHHSSVANNKIIPVDILDTPNQLIVYLDLPGVSKSDIQVTVEEENILVVKSNGKRKRDDDEINGEQGCKYLRLERRLPQNLVRKFRLPENCDVSKITAKCENGVLTLAVEKLPPPPKSKTVQVSIS
uniref:17.4 kDa class III heat shock protein n=1 Tax=Erigeron canadensis TaxID=72917 RepID=UPI001CB8AE5C|nr:17.4 kDa class III heat shock protein [Erigeron canadensis]